MRRSLNPLASCLLLASAMAASIPAQAENAQQNASPPALTEQNLAAWVKHIEPTGEDLLWQEIPWLPTLTAGILEADKKKKPILFWTMNGHPLACT